MRNGIGLNDDLRLNWLIRLRQLLVNDWYEKNLNGVLACSALKQKYRHLLNSNILYNNCHNDAMINSINLNLIFIMIDLDRLMIEKRLSQRSNHDIIKNASILDSQFETLEKPKSNDSVVLKFNNSFLYREICMLDNNQTQSYLIYVYKDVDYSDTVDIVTDKLIDFLKSNSNILNV